MGVARLRIGHLADSFGEKVRLENPCALREEAEDEPRHELVEFGPTRIDSPILVVLQELDIEPVEPAGRLDVDRVVRDLADGGDARERQEEAEVFCKVGIGARDRVARA